jgi:hypothetical protein
MKILTGIATVFIGFVLAHAAHAETFDTPGGVTCRQHDKQPTVLEVEKNVSGDLIVRLSGYNLFNGAIPNLRTVEATFKMSNCEPGQSSYWLGGDIFTCIGPDVPLYLDSNGTQLDVHGNFQRIYLSDTLELHPLLPAENKYRYDIQITTDQQVYQDTDYFYTDPAFSQSECTLSPSE